MLTRPRRLLAALLVALVAVAAVACTPENGNGPEDSDGGVNRPIGDDALGDDEVTLHMVNPPELPPALEGADVTPAELRTVDLTERHTVQLVDVPADTTTLDEALPDGAVLRVAAGQALEIDAAVDVASLDPDATEDDPGVVAEVDSPCASPCAVEGPALITGEGWMSGFGVASTWQLLVPSPIG